MYIENMYYFWTLTQELVVKQGFEILHVNDQKNEVWLEKEIDKKNHVVRLLMEQFDWSNQLNRDIDRILHHMKRNHRMFVGKEIAVHSVYVSEYPPVDDWNNREEPIKIKGNKEVRLTVHFLDAEQRQTNEATLFEMLSLPNEQTGTEKEVTEKEQMLPYIKQNILLHAKKKQKEKENLFNYGKPLITYLLLVLNIIIFAYIEWNGSSTSVTNLVQYGAKYNPAIVDGEWWRIISSMFLHIGYLHLIMNMLALYYLGVAVERIYGTARFTIIYLLAGIFGGLASFAFNPHVAAGASGAIFGLFGALLFFGVKHKKIFFRTMGSNLLFIIGLNIVLGLSVPQIDNGAHLGGLAGGFLASAIVHLPKNRQPIWQGTALLGYLIAFTVLGTYGYNNDENTQHTALDVEITSQWNEEGKYEEAVELATEAIQKGGQFEKELYFNRSFAYYQLDKEEDFQKDLERAIEIANERNEEFPEAHYNLALLYNEQGEKEKAAYHAKQAAEQRPSDDTFRELNETLNQ
ncbi:rhomboid family intramembrane serine protease [Thalassobacillus hwangdonensis]|uniref:Rhomboid family intramembrane serine protease n=1 Tax=Thalassobacillus hwangdonensis TaxID=546108 RepID=A0ABW3KYY5_9BACI